MPKRHIDEHEKNLNAATCFTFFFAAQSFTRSGSTTIYFAITGLGALFAIYCWANWFRIRKRSGNTDVASFSDILRNGSSDVGNWLLLWSVVLILPCFVLLGALTSGLRGAIISAGFGMLNVAAIFLIERYPLGIESRR